MWLRAGPFPQVTVGTGCQVALRTGTHLWPWLPPQACPAHLPVGLALCAEPPCPCQLPVPKGAIGPCCSLAQAQASHQKWSSRPGHSPAPSPQTSWAVRTMGCPLSTPPCSLAGAVGQAPAARPSPGPKEQPPPLCPSPCLVAKAAPEYSKPQPHMKISPQADSGS